MIDKLKTLRSFMVNSYDDARNSLETNSAMNISHDIKYIDGIIADVANEDKNHKVADISQSIECSDWKTTSELQWFETVEVLDETTGRNILVLQQKQRNDKGETRWVTVPTVG